MHDLDFLVGRISTKIGDEIQNERYLCERHDELTTIISKQGSDWPAYMTQ